MTISIDRTQFDKYLRKRRGYSLEAFDSALSAYYPGPREHLYSLVLLESGFNPNARNPSGAIGLFQGLKKYFPSAVASRSLSAQRPMLLEMVRKYEISNDFLALYLQHFLPPLYNAHKKNPDARYLECKLDKGRYATAGMQYCSLASRDGSRFFPVIDQFAMLQFLSERWAAIGVSATFSVVDNVDAIAGQDGVLYKGDFADTVSFSPRIMQTTRFKTVSATWDFSNKGGWQPFAPSSAVALLRDELSVNPSAVSFIPGDGLDQVLVGSAHFGNLSEDVDAANVSRYLRTIHTERSFSLPGGTFVFTPLAEDFDSKNEAAAFAQSASRTLSLAEAHQSEIPFVHRFSPSAAARPFRQTAMSHYQFLAFLRALRNRGLKDAPYNLIVACTRNVGRENVPLLEMHTAPYLLPEEAWPATAACIVDSSDSLLYRKLALHVRAGVSGSSPDVSFPMESLIHSEFLYPFSMLVTPVVPLDTDPSSAFVSRHVVPLSLSADIRLHIAQLRAMSLRINRDSIYLSPVLVDRIQGLVSTLSEPDNADLLGGIPFSMDKKQALSALRTFISSGLTNP